VVIRVVCLVVDPVVSRVVARVDCWPPSLSLSLFLFLRVRRSWWWGCR
jgi:hypothetical protein